MVIIFYFLFYFYNFYLSYGRQVVVTVMGGYDWVGCASGGGCGLSEVMVDQ